MAELALQPFTWGSGGEMLTPEQLDRRRKVADALRQREGYVPAGWMSLLGSLAGEGVAAYKDAEIDKQESEAQKRVADALMSARGGSDPNAYLNVMSDPFASPQQSAIASALYQQAQPDYQTMSGPGGDVLRWNQNDPNARPEVFYDAPDAPPPEGYHPMTAEERAAWGIPAEDTTPYALGPDNMPKAISDGNPLVQVNTGEGADNALNKKLSEAEGEQWAGYKAAGTVSASNAQDFAVLDELIKIAPQGPVVGPLAETFKGFSSAGDAFQSIVKRIAPTLRAPGSGATSDIEYEGMLRSLPALGNTPQANQMISSIMKAKAQVNIERSNLISQYQAGQIDIGTARQKMNELDSMSIITPEMRQALLGVGGTGEIGAQVPQVGEVVDGYVFLGGDPSSPVSWRKQ